MRQANIFVDGEFAGWLDETEPGKRYRFTYEAGYTGGAVSLLMPISQQVYEWDRFPPFFEGVLPEGFMLDALLRKSKIDADDYFAQLVLVGGDLVGNVTVEAA